MDTKTINEFLQRNEANLDACNRCQDAAWKPGNAAPCYAETALLDEALPLANLIITQHGNDALRADFAATFGRTS